MSTLPRPVQAIAPDPGATPTVGAPLVVRTVELDDPGPLLDLLPLPLRRGRLNPAGLVSWVRRGEGLVGWGRAASFTTAGPERFAEADQWWRHTAAHAVVRDEVGMPGTGPVCFGTFPFADDSTDAGPLVVPRVTVGHKRRTAGG
jgi:menaquinone-specific isochorismate synthase